MRWSTVWWLALLAVISLEGNWSRAAPSPQTEDMLKTLLELDRMYSAVARPSVRSGPPNSTGMGPKVQRAINMLRLQHLERLYADRARPRFGKRAEAIPNFAVLDYEGQGRDANDWLPARR